MISDKTCINFNEVANNLLGQFVEEYSYLYRDEYVSYNVLVHSLIHLAKFVKFTVI